MESLVVQGTPDRKVECDCIISKSLPFDGSVTWMHTGWERVELSDLQLESHTDVVFFL